MRYKHNDLETNSTKNETYQAYILPLAKIAIYLLLRQIDSSE